MGEAGRPGGSTAAEWQDRRRELGLNFRDRTLARRMLAGDERAFDEFFEGHFPGLYRFALTRLDRDEDAAEEVALGPVGCR